MTMRSAIWLPLATCAAVVSAPILPRTNADAPGAAARRPVAPPDVVVLAGGCYWGVESVYRHVRGVQSAVSGYATPVGSSEPAEAVRITYDPSQISYHRLLDIFFGVVHDPTQLNRQGPDVGTEYRSIVFVDGAQRAVARAYIDSLTASHVFRRPIVTEVDALARFDPVDASQQNYAAKHPDQPYIAINDAPKLKALARTYPALFKN
jgi:peptide-methionine (S)-S-oxide reductase